jgi:biotin synthase
MLLTREDIRAAFAESDASRWLQAADKVRSDEVGSTVYLRGLLEVSNICVRSCLYCGLRRENARLTRYRMTREEILSAAGRAYEHGLRTIVLQSGDGVYSRAEICSWVESIRRRHPDMAITLSLGERPLEDYAVFRKAGADRYLLKHETINPDLYQRLHPGQSWKRRLRILEHLRELGYQVGAGFIVGLPGQTAEDLVEEMLFLQKFQPDMVGIGPFLPQRDTPLAGVAAGDVNLTIRSIALARCVTKNALIPATTALLTLDPEQGFELGLKAGANVVMISVTPDMLREQYRLYDGRVRMQLDDIRRRIAALGRVPSGARGDSPKKCAWVSHG